MNKKAIQESLLTLILGIVIFILILGLSTTINAAIHKSRIREYCRLSIVTVEVSKEATFGAIKPSLDCPMQTIEIKKENLPKKNPEDYVKRIFAQAMYDAWYVAGRGEHRKFQSKLFGGDVSCLIYARINFDDKIKEENLDLGGMTQWMTVNNPLESTTSYFSYLTYNDKRAFHIIDASDPNNIKDSETIDPSKNYYVVYWALMKSTKTIGALSPLIGALAQLNDLTSSIGEGRIPQIFVVPEEQFESIKCNSLLN